MFQETRCLKRCQEHKHRLLHLYIDKLFLSQRDVGLNFLHDLNSVLDWHLEIKQTDTYRLNCRIQAAYVDSFIQRSVNKFLALIDRELPIDANVAYLVDT